MKRVDLINNLYLPLTFNIAKLLGSEFKYKKFKHLTSINYIEKLCNIDNDSQICCFTKNIESVISNTSLIQHDLLIELKGREIFKFKYDILSVKDEYGLRWIKFNTKNNFIENILKNKIFNNFKDYTFEIERILKVDLYLNIIKNSLKYKNTEHDEIIVDNIEILNIFSIENGKFRYDVDNKYLNVLNTLDLGNKYKGHLNKENFKILKG